MPLLEPVLGKSCFASKVILCSEAQAFVKKLMLCSDIHAFAYKILHNVCQSLPQFKLSPGAIVDAQINSTAFSSQG